MNAHVIQGKVVETEEKLCDEISGLISERINELSDQTGLVFNSIDLQFVETTSVESVSRQILVTGVSLNMSLPDKIRG